MVASPSPSVRSPLSVLVTGFDPFGGSPTNPSWHAVHALHGREIAGHRIVGAELPTVFGRALQRLEQLLEEYRPGLVICTGQAGGRAAISLERVAINVDDARIPDNAGAQPIDRPVVPGAPAAYFSTLPIKAMLAALHAHGLPAEISNSAGTYVCNHIAYAMLHLAARRRGTRAGFIHIPYLPEQAAMRRGAPSMAAGDVVRGLEIALRTATATRIDSKLGAGALD